MVIVFDVGSRKSFERVETYWKEQLEAKAEPDATVMLVGSKVDIAGKLRQV